MTTLNRTASNWSAQERAKINENWEILERGVSQQNNQNNNLLVVVEEAKTNSENALSNANQANVNANLANQKANDVQSQFDRVVADGDSNAEVVQARGNNVNLRQRLDNEQTFVQTNIENLNTQTSNNTNSIETTNSDLLSRGISIKQIAVGDGVTNDTDAIAAVFAANNSNVYIFDNSTYLVDRLHFPNNSFIYFNNTTIKRNSLTNDSLVKTGENSFVFGNVNIDGNKFSTGSARETGISLEANTVTSGEISTLNNDGHGIRVANNVSANVLISRNNGNNPGPSGTGDGVYLSNANDVLINKVIVSGNARTGFVVSTYDAVTTGEDPELSKNVKVNYLISNDNAYNDTNIESASLVQIDKIEGNGTLSSSKSIRCTYKNASLRNFYATNCQNIVIDNFVLSPSTSNGLALFLSGSNPVIKNVLVKDTAETYLSNTFEVVDPVSNNAVVENVTITKGYNAFVVNGCSQMLNCDVLEFINRPMTVNLARIQSGQYKKTKVVGSVLQAYGSLIPTVGTWTAGSVLTNISPIENGEAGTKYVIDSWKCIETGTPGTWIQNRFLTGN